MIDKSTIKFTLVEVGVAKEISCRLTIAGLVACEEVPKKIGSMTVLSFRRVIKVRDVIGIDQYVEKENDAYPVRSA